MSPPIAPGQSVPRLCLNRNEVAASLGVSPNTVDEMVREGNLPEPKRWHTRKLWLVSEISAYIAEWPTDGGTGRAIAPSTEDVWRARA